MNIGIVITPGIQFGTPMDWHKNYPVPSTTHRPTIHERVIIPRIYLLSAGWRSGLLNGVLNIVRQTLGNTYLEVAVLVNDLPINNDQPNSKSCETAHPERMVVRLRSMDPRALVHDATLKTNKSGKRAQRA